VTIYIVLSGEFGDGGLVKGVSATIEQARAAALSMRACFAGGWMPDGAERWRNGCDRVWIEGHEVLI